MRNGWAWSGPSWSWNSVDGTAGSSPLPTSPMNSWAGGSRSAKSGPAAASTSDLVASAADRSDSDRTRAVIRSLSTAESMAARSMAERSRKANGSTGTVTGGWPNTARQTRGSTGGDTRVAVTPGRALPLIRGWNCSAGAAVTNAPQSATSG